MGLSDSLKDALGQAKEKATEFAGKHSSTIDSGLDKVGEEDPGQPGSGEAGRPGRDGHPAGAAAGPGQRRVLTGRPRRRAAPHRRRAGGQGGGQGLVQPATR